MCSVEGNSFNISFTIATCFKQDKAKETRVLDMTEEHILLFIRLFLLIACSLSPRKYPVSGHLHGTLGRQAATVPAVVQIQ